MDQQLMQLMNLIGAASINPFHAEIFTFFVLYFGNDFEGNCI
jgi:hypothetical protein